MGATETLKQQTGLAKKPATIHQLLESLKPQIALALPRHLQPERMLRIALTALKTTPKLMECEPQSILASVMLASQLGLEPGVMGQCYLVPYYNRDSKKHICTLIPGWQGILSLVNRAGKAMAWTGAVYQGDEFEWSLGDNPHIHHQPCGDEEVLTHAYAVGRLNGYQWPVIEVWPMAKIISHRNRYNKVGDSHYSYKHMEMYARKIALLQVLKYVPRSVELATAFSVDAAAETGQQNLKIADVKEILEGSFAELPESTTETEGYVAPNADPSEAPATAEFLGPQESMEPDPVAQERREEIKKQVKEIENRKPTSGRARQQTSGVDLEFGDR